MNQRVKAKCNKTIFEVHCYTQALARSQILPTQGKLQFVHISSTKVIVLSTIFEGFRASVGFLSVKKF